MPSDRNDDYQRRLAAESRKWGDHLQVEASGEWHAWLDHPFIRSHYAARSAIDGLPWERWVATRLGRPAAISLDLGCGAGGRSMRVFDSGSTLAIEGLDVSEDRIAEAERVRRQRALPGAFQVADVNTVKLPRGRYDLIFSAHSFHHFVELEHVMEQVHDALTPEGLFILDEFVGPTQFQWTDRQLELTRLLIESLPQSLRSLRSGEVKPYEGRPTPEEVVRVSPFESIRSGDILPLFFRYFDVELVRNAGGTIQHLLYNGIIHNFRGGEHDATQYLEAIIRVEDALIDGGMLPSDFMLLVGRRKDSARHALPPSAQ